MKDILDPNSDIFNPLPASVSLLDPTIGKLLLVPDMTGLLRVAKLDYSISRCLGWKSTCVEGIKSFLPTN